MVAVYPTVRDSPSLDKFVAQSPEALKAFIGFGGAIDYTSAAGYLGGELFSFMVPLLLLLAAIGAGARAIAGEEEVGTLELLLSCPISRRRLVLEKLAALVVETTALGVVLLVSLWVGARLDGHLARAPRGGDRERRLPRARVRRARPPRRCRHRAARAAPSPSSQPSPSPRSSSPRSRRS